MGARLFYFARPYFERTGRLYPGEAMPFVCARDAEDGGLLLAKMAAGVVVYQQLGDPDFDLWEEPEILAVHGAVSAKQLTEAAA